MPSLRTFALPILAALITAAAAAAAQPEIHHAAPALAAGDEGGAELLPSVVDTRLAPVRAALTGATNAVNEGRTAAASTLVSVAASNLTGAWNAAKYVIETAPPPPADDDGLAAGDGGAGLLYSGPEATSVAVLTAQHDFVVTAVKMMATSNATLAARLATAVAAVQGVRATAIAHIHSVAPPTSDDDGEADGTEAGSSWDAVMPQLADVLDDEIRQLNGSVALGGYSAPSRTALAGAITRAKSARTLVLRYWPPVGDD